MNFYQPTDMMHLTQLLKTKLPTDAFLAGGTDLMLKADPARTGIISLDKLDELRMIVADQNAACIGALCTHDTVSRTDYLPQALREACRNVGSQQVRNRGTLGGSLCNASASGDIYPVLLALDAHARVLNPDGTVQEIPMEDLISPEGKLNLRHDQVLTDFLLTTPSNARSTFAKLAERSVVSIAKIDLAVAVQLEQDRITSARVVLGAVAPRAVRCAEAERWLSGRTLTDLPAKPFADLLSAHIRQLCAGRSSMPYKAKAVLGPAAEVLTALQK